MEARRHLFRSPGVAGGVALVAHQRCPGSHLLQRVMPERIDLNGLAAARCDHPVAYLGVHPGELHAGLASAQQTIGRVHHDAVARTVSMPLDNVDQHRVKLAQQGVIGAGGNVVCDGVEVPQRCVNGVVFRRIVAVRKTIWQHPFADMSGKCAQHGRRFGQSSAVNC